MLGMSKLPPWAWYVIGSAAMLALFALSHVGGPNLVMPILLTGVVVALGFVAIGWTRSDEATKEAHKVAWWHGGNAGLVIAALTVMSLPWFPALRDLIGGLVAHRQHPELGAFGLGVMFVMAAQFALYIAIWTGWWIAKR